MSRQRKGAVHHASECLPRSALPRRVGLESEHSLSLRTPKPAAMGAKPRLAALLLALACATMSVHARFDFSPNPVRWALLALSIRRSSHAHASPRLPSRYGWVVVC
jgi:hypothetical protein